MQQPYRCRKQALHPRQPDREGEKGAGDGIWGGGGTRTPSVIPAVSEAGSMATSQSISLPPSLPAATSAGACDSLSASCVMSHWISCLSPVSKAALSSMPLAELEGLFAACEVPLPSSCKSLLLLMECKCGSRQLGSAVVCCWGVLGSAGVCCWAGLGSAAAELGAGE